MSYATNIESSISDSNYMRYVGYREQQSLCIQDYFSDKTVDMISNKISELLMGVHPQNKKLVVSKDVITSIMSNIYQNYRPETGDIYSRYIIPTRTPNDMVQDMINQTIESITSQVRSDYQMRENNAKLTVWTTVLGDFNTFGLRQHAPIKIRNKRPNPMEFNMRY